MAPKGNEEKSQELSVEELAERFNETMRTGSSGSTDEDNKQKGQ